MTFEGRNSGKGQSALGGRKFSNLTRRYSGCPSHMDIRLAPVSKDKGQYSMSRGGEGGESVAVSSLQSPHQGARGCYPDAVLPRPCKCNLSGSGPNPAFHGGTQGTTSDRLVAGGNASGWGCCCCLARLSHKPAYPTDAPADTPFQGAGLDFSASMWCLPVPAVTHPRDSPK